MRTLSLSLLAASLVGAVLTACGGSGGDASTKTPLAPTAVPTALPTSVPTSAPTSVPGTSSYSYFERGGSQTAKVATLSGNVLEIADLAATVDLTPGACSANGAGLSTCSSTAPMHAFLLCEASASGTNGQLSRFVVIGSAIAQRVTSADELKGRTFGYSEDCAAQTNTLTFNQDGTVTYVDRDGSGVIPISKVPDLIAGMDMDGSTQHTYIFIYKQTQDGSTKYFAVEQGIPLNGLGGYIGLWTQSN